MESIPEIDASPTVDSEDKHKHVCLKEQKEQHNLDRSQTHPKQLVQTGEEDEGSLSGYGWSHDPGEVVQYSKIPEGTTLPTVASTEDRHTPVNTSGEHACRISSEPSLNPESLLVQEISDNSSLPTQNANRQPTVISEDAGTVTNTYGYNTERISRKQWKAINIFVLDVEQKIIASNKWLQFSEAIGYDMSVERKKIGSEPKQFYKLLNEWITVMKETERNPIPYLKWALKEVDEEDLVTKLTQKFGSNKPTVRIDGAALVLTGRTTTIGCTISSPESVSELTWFKDVNKLQLASNSSKYGGGSIQTPSLTIRNVNDIDKASYRCEATNIAGTGQSKVVHLDVAGKPTIHLSYKSTVLRGNKSMIDCSVTSKIPITSLQWYKDGHRILPTSMMFSGGSIVEPSLTLNNFSKQHEGKYRCEVSNGAGTVSSDDAVIDIGDMPVISLTSLTYTVKAAGFVTLRCQISGNPKPEIQWYRLVDGEKHIIKESLKYSGGTVKVPSLTITNVDENDIGSYILNAHNVFGESWSEKVTVKGEIPRITLNSDTSVLFGKAITIVCLLESDIQTLNWFKDDCELSLDNKHFIGGKLDSPHLTITAASKSDEGKYTCKGITQFGTTISNTISIMVLFDKPKVTIDESNISTEAGTRIQLKCSIISEPSITRINWYKTENGKSTQISYSGRHTGGSIQQPFLSIKNANPNDSGVYFCEVENIAGKGCSRNVHLEIKEALPVISISKNLEGRENQPIKLICNIKSGLPVQSLLWYKEVDGRQREIFENGIKYEGGHSRIPELTILHCDKTDTGFYICRVANSFGQSSSEKCFLQVSYKPVITVPLEKNVMDGQSVDIDCSVDAKPDIDSLQWYRLIDGQFIELQQASKHYTGGNKRNPSLSIVNIGKYDEGAYRCRASNSVGECLSDNCQLKVSSKPEVLIEHSTLSCKIGQSISIECRVQADPAVQHVKWLKKDKGKGKQGKITQLKQTKNETFEHSIKPSLTIRDVQKTDSGHYFCEATNIAGTTKSEPIVLDVATNISDPSINIIVLAYIVDRCSVSIFKEHIVDLSDTSNEVNNIQIADFIIEDERDQQYLETLNRKIPSTKIVFLLLSKDFVDKAWPNVSNMTNLNDCVYSRKPPLVPVYLEQFSKLPFGLRSVQCLYFYRNDSAYKAALGKLLQGLF